MIMFGCYVANYVKKPKVQKKSKSAEKSVQKPATSENEEETSITTEEASTKSE